MKPKNFKPQRSIKRSKGAKITPKIKIYIFCEGKKTEPTFFEKFKLLHANGLVKVKITPAAGVPKTIVDCASQKKKELDILAKKSDDPIENNFEVWAVFDCDEHPKIPEAFNKAKSNKVKVAYSNPCFEIWPYLHFQNQTAAILRHKLQIQLEKELPTYNKNKAKSVDPSEIDKDYNTARNRAKSLKKEHENVGTPKASPYTDVYILLDTIKKNGKPIK